MTSIKYTHIAIVGAGFCGAMTALHLIKNSKGPLQITIIEPRPVPGRGMAYSTPSDGHLLNVPAAGMSAFADDMEHFQRWATERKPDTDARTFVPRKMFGDYISGMLKESMDKTPQHIVVAHKQESVLAINKNDIGGFVLELNGGESLEADYVVLALGNMIGKKPRWAQEAGQAAQNYLHDPWQTGAIEAIKADEDVLIIGTGLTAVDKLIEFDLQKHRGTIYATSRHGLWPRAHVHRLVGVKDPATVPGGNVAAAIKSLREQIGKSDKVREDADAWRVIFDGLRADTQKWWQTLDKPERKRFLRHVRTYYDVHRHRMAPQIAAVVERMEQSGLVKTSAARVASVIPNGAGKFEVVLAPRHGQGKQTNIIVDRIINCMGPQANIEAIENPLLRTLVAGGLVGLNDLASGIAVTAQGQVLSPQGEPEPGLYAIGPLLISKLLESVAVPELRGQAANLAKLLLDEVEHRMTDEDGRKNSAFGTLNS
jgi:uncharacterized NAD(P)/FAD-binding protein YdhS